MVQAMAEATAARKPAFGRRDPKPWSGMVAGRVQACINHLVGRTWTAHQAGIDWVASTSTRDGRWRRCRLVLRWMYLPISHRWSD